MEHRWGQRLQVRTRVGLSTHGGLHGIGYIRDVSISGALVVTGLRVTLMSTVKVLLPPGLASRAASIEGQVVRATSTGFAVEWAELAPELMQAVGGSAHLPNLGSPAEHVARGYGRL